MSEPSFSYITCGELTEVPAAHPAVHASGRGPRAEEYCGWPNLRPDFPCFFYLATKEGELVASTRALPDVLVTPGRSLPWAWTCDLYTQPAFRQRGFATLLQRQTTALLHERGIGRGSVFSAKLTRRIYQEIGSTLAGYAPRYLLLKSLRPFLAAHVKDQRVLGAMDALSHPVLRTIARVCWASGRAAASCAPLRLDRCMATLSPADAGGFADVRHTAPFHFDDGFEAISWKLQLVASSPETRCDFYFLTNRKRDRVGYFITRLNRVDEPIAGKYQGFLLLTLMHFGVFTDDPRFYAAVVDHLLELFWSSAADAVEVITTCEPLLSAARARGMYRVGNGMSFTLSVPPDWNFGPAEHDVRKYSLTHFQGDGFTA